MQIQRKSNRYDVVSDPLKSHHTRQTDIAEVIWMNPPKHTKGFLK